MRIKSVSGVTCYVTNLNKTVEFYQSLGFDFKKIEDWHATGYINWFWIDFVAIEQETDPQIMLDAKRANKGSGIYLSMSVEDIDELHQQLTNSKVTFFTKSPVKGSKQFTIVDPDGYKLTFFENK